MQMKSIVEKAKMMGVDPTGMEKAELIRAIQRAEGYSQCFGTAVDNCVQLACCWRNDCLKPAKKTRFNNKKKR